MILKAKTRPGCNVKFSVAPSGLSDSRIMSPNMWWAGSEITGDLMTIIYKLLVKENYSPKPMWSIYESSLFWKWVYKRTHARDENKPVPDFKALIDRLIVSFQDNLQARNRNHLWSSTVRNAWHWKPHWVFTSWAPQIPQEVTGSPMSGANKIDKPWLEVEQP